MSKKSNKVKALLLALLFVLCTGVGVLFGHISSQDKSRDAFKALADILKNNSIYAVLPIYAIGSVAVSIVQTVMLKKCKAFGKAMDEDDDESYEKLNEMLEKPLNTSNILTIIMCVLFAIVVESALFIDSISKTARMVICIGSSVLFIGVYIYQFIIIRSVIEYYKTLNPEKKGDILDMNFQSRWLSSFDESEKYTAYRCGFNAYKNANYACNILWVVSFISQFTFNTGVMPVICIGVIWLIMTFSYISESKRIEKNGLQSKE